MPDVLRGISLLGIIMVNAPYFALGASSGYFDGGWVDAADGFMTWVVATLFQGKFYLIFSFLYGYSATYIVRTIEHSATRWLRRSIVLLFLGVAHAVFLFHGDILFVYGLVGIVIVRALKSEPKRLSVTLRRTAWIVGSYYVVIATALILLAVLGAETSENVTHPLSTALAEGTYADAVSIRFATWFDTSVAVIFLQGPLVALAALAGIAAGRRRLLTSAWTSSWSRATRWGLVIGLPVQAALSYFAIYASHIGLGVELSYALTVIGMLTAPILAVGIIGAVAFGVQRGFAVGRNLGRMSLTAYLSESLLLGVAFSAWGLGLAGTSALIVVLVGFVVWLILDTFARGWFTRAGKGPVESLVGILTRSRMPTS